MDGLKGGPIFLGNISLGEDWWHVAKPAIEKRMQLYNSSETHFALLSICKQRASMLEAEIIDLQQRLDLSVTSNIVMDNDQRIELVDLIGRLKLELSDEYIKINKQKQENIRRRHNYVPFIVELLKGMAKKGALTEIIETRK